MRGPEDKKGDKQPDEPLRSTPRRWDKERETPVLWDEKRKRNRGRNRWRREVEGAMPANGREREPLEARRGGEGRGRERGRERERKDRVKQDRGRGGNGWTGEWPAASLRTTWPHRPCRHHSASPASFQRSRLAFQPANALGSPTGLLPDRSGPRSPTPLSLDLRTRYSSPLPTSLISCSSASPPSSSLKLSFRVFGYAKKKWSNEKETVFVSRCVMVYTHRAWLAARKLQRA